MGVDEIIRHLGLWPLVGEGGYFAETWRGPDAALSLGSHALDRQRRPLGTAIYYLVTPGAFSALHRLKTDEVFHFYVGDPCQMLLLGPSGEVETRVLGTDLVAGMRPQVVVPAGWWQGTRLLEPTPEDFALLGTTMAPGYHPDDVELAQCTVLDWRYAEKLPLIAPFFPET